MLDFAPKRHIYQGKVHLYHLWKICTHWNVWRCSCVYAYALVRKILCAPREAFVHSTCMISNIHMAVNSPSSELAEDIYWQATQLLQCTHCMVPDTCLRHSHVTRPMLAAYDDCHSFTTQKPF